MDDANVIVSEMTVTISKHVIEIFRQHKADCRQFLESNSSESYVVKEVGGTYQLIGKYEGIKYIRNELTKKLEMFAAALQQQPKANSTRNTEVIERQVPTLKVDDGADGNDVRVVSSSSRTNIQIVNTHSHSTEGQSVQEAAQESLPKPKRVRKLKSPTPGGDTSTEAGTQSGLAERRVEDVTVLVGETKTLEENGDEVSIEVDRDRHHYLMSHYENEMKKHLPSFHADVVEGGMLKVTFAFKSKKNSAANITSKYNSYLNRFQFEVIRVPDGIDGSVLHSLVSLDENKLLSLTFVFDEANMICKLIGNKKEVDKIKKLINDHASEQLKTSKDTEGTWEVQNSKKKGKKTASIIYYSIEHGKLNRCESSQAPATKKCSLQVNLYECKTKVPATEAILRAIDSKMQGFGDAKAAIEFESGKKYKDECRKIMNVYHNSIGVGEVVHTITGDTHTQQRTKIKFIVHVVLEEKKVSASASPVVAMKDVIYRCLHHADKLQIKSISFPHLGGSDYCDIGSFVRGSVEALQSFAPTAHHLQRVCFVVKDSKTLQELADEFETSIDHQHNSQFTSSSESSGKDHMTSL